ncbi:MAG: pyrophosphorylase [Actinobacteria bacterium]|nr:pyrophosphorylase [Actinomycetota bacterium]
MSGKVLSTPQAKDSIARMQTIINSGLAEQIDQLVSQGNVLCQPDVWDGSLAGTFRGEWPNTSSALKKAQADLEALRQKVQTINQNIMAAGGNA